MHFTLTQHGNKE